MACALLMTGCSMMVSSATDDLAENLSYAFANSNDPATVEAGGPAYLLMIDGLLHGDPDNTSLLLSAADMYSAYTGMFVEDNARAQKLTEKSLGYALRAYKLRSKDARPLQTMEFKEFEGLIAGAGKSDLPTLFTVGASWAAWIQARRQDWNAVAEIPRVEAIMRRVLALDETWRDGQAHLYLGKLTTLLPAALGGKPEEGRAHFERAMELSGHRNLMAGVMFARSYARLVFDRPLHDRLLKEVLEADPDKPGYLLINISAQREARQLLESADDYF
ncbi:MAG: hypothetical protein GY859_13075 [Desulfobacterales bacterium]|nr:hypothetical protein [Desulfobacterales bacterium]